MTNQTPPGPWDYLSKDGIDRAVAALEAPRASQPATFDAWCYGCRARTPHQELRFGQIVTWQCQMCGYPVEGTNEQKRAA